MKKIAVLIIFCFGVVLVCQAQKPYSVENLKKLSQEELDVYYTKALKLQKSGKTVNIVGGAVFGGTLLTTFVFGGSWGMGALIVIVPAIYVALGALVVGIPMTLTGKKRVERINTIRSTTFSNVTFNLQPCAQFNNTTQKYQPGISLKISF